MKLDIFLSICQTDVDGHMPSEKIMFQNFFDQVRLADELEFGTAWVAETHLSCQVQKENPGSVIPHFKGEIGLNTDILQLAQRVFAQTKKIHVGSAIRNIICNGGPIAHAEAVRTFLSLQEYDSGSGSPGASGAGVGQNRRLELGFAAGRFPFSNTPYGFYPKNEFEEATWEVLKNKFFGQATEIFLRLLKGEKISSKELRPMYLQAKDFRQPADWERALSLASSLARRVGAASTHYEVQSNNEAILIPPHWIFPKVGVIPFDTSLKNLGLTIGSHDPETQILANQILPVGVFNLSITPPAVIEETHQRMQKHFHADGGPWKREYMPRTVMLFVDENRQKAKDMAERAWRNYWTAMENTLDPKKVEQAVGNTIAGDPSEVRDLIQSKYHTEDRLMLWFDFNNHDNAAVKKAMQLTAQVLR